MTDRGNRTAGRLTGVTLAVLIVLAVVTAMGAQNQNTPNEIPDPDDIRVTDTTTPIPEADYDYTTEDGIRVTDTTLALAPDPEPVPDSASVEETPPTITTLGPSTTTTTFIARVDRPNWDHRLPANKNEFEANECTPTFDTRLVPRYQYSYDQFYERTDGQGWGDTPTEVLGRALTDPSYEPTPGTEFHDALSEFGVSSAQDIRDIGEYAADVRWFAWWIKRTIIKYGDPDLPACATIIAGANAVLNAPLTTTTTTTLGPSTTFIARVDRPNWDHRLPANTEDLEANECTPTFDTRLVPRYPYSYDQFYWRTGGWGNTPTHVLGSALTDPSYEPTPGTEYHNALAEFGVSSAQDIRDIGEYAADVRWFAWWIKRRIIKYGDPDLPACATIIAGANAVLNAPLNITTTTTP